MSPLQSQQKLVYDVSKWDSIQWENFLDADDDNQEFLETGTKKIPSFPIFSSEIFHRLYAPDEKPLAETLPEAQWAVQAHAEITENPEFNDLKTLIEVEAAGDPFKKLFLAGTGTASISKAVALRLPKSRTSNNNPQELQQQHDAISQQLLNLQQQLPDGQPVPLNLQEQITELQQQLKAIARQHKLAVKNTQKYAQRTKASLQKTIASAIQQATSATQQVADSLDAMGLGWGMSPGNPTGKGLPWQQKMELATKISHNPKLAKIAKLAGRLKMIAAKKQCSRANQVNRSYTGVTLGNDLNNVLPSEFALLTVPTLKPVFFRNYSQQALLQFQHRSKEKLGKGPIVVCLDESGSMSGEKEHWSKAVAIALLSIANKQKRTCRIIHFSDGVERVDDFPQGNLDPAKLLECMEFFSAGGTNWEEPLDSALSIIKSEREYKKADIILIGDDLCNVSSDWLTRFKRSQQTFDFNTYGVLIGHPNSEGMKQILDTVIAIEDLNSDREIETVFEI